MVSITLFENLLVATLYFVFFLISTRPLVSRHVLFFVVFVDSRWGTPGKRVPDGLSEKVSRFNFLTAKQSSFAFQFSSIKTEFVLCFWSFC